MTGIILAAGKSKRMGLNQSKVLLLLKGRPVLEWIIRLTQKLPLQQTLLVISPHRKDIEQIFSNFNVKFVIQPEQKGTADAVRVCQPFLASDEDILVLCGDTPLLRLQTIEKLVDVYHKNQADVVLLSAILESPQGYGRIVRNKQNRIVGIIEEKCADEKIRAIKEINAGVYVIRYKRLQSYLENIKPSIIDSEYYLTSAITEIIKDGGKVESVTTTEPNEILGINTPEDWEKVEKLFAQDIRAD